MSGKKLYAIIGVGAVGCLAVIVLLFMFIPQMLVGDSVGGEAWGLEATETKVVTPYKNTLDHHIGRIIVSCDVPKKDYNICINAVSGMTNDSNAIYIQGLDEDGVRYCVYTTVNKTQSVSYVEPGADDDTWENKVANRVVFEEKSDRIQIE